MEKSKIYTIGDNHRVENSVMINADLCEELYDHLFKVYSASFMDFFMEIIYIHGQYQNILWNRENDMRAKRIVSACERAIKSMVHWDKSKKVHYQEADNY